MTRRAAFLLRWRSGRSWLARHRLPSAAGGESVPHRRPVARRTDPSTAEGTSRKSRHADDPDCRDIEVGDLATEAIRSLPTAMGALPGCRRYRERGLTLRPRARPALCRGAGTVERTCSDLGVPAATTARKIGALPVAGAALGG